MKKSTRTLLVRILCMVLVGVMCLGLIAVAASAEGEKVNLMRKNGSLAEKDYYEAAYDYFWNQHSIQRDWVHTIRFQSTLEGMPADVWDFSANYNRSVLGWYQNNVLTIAADGMITLPVDSSWLFAYFINVRTIDFNDSVITSDVQNMEAMFFCCNNLEGLNVSGFDTASVTNMGRMFGECRSLNAIDVSGFDTAKVENFSFMFEGCLNVTKLDVSGFDTANGRYFHSMFCECRSLCDLDVSGFNTSNARTISFMFKGCHGLEGIDVSHFDTSRVTTDFILPGI